MMFRAVTLATPLALAAMIGTALADARHDEAARLCDAQDEMKAFDRQLNKMRDQFVSMLATRTGKDSVFVGQIVDQVLMPSVRGLEPTLRGIMIDVYAKNLSVDEMRGLEQFMATPLGHKLIDKLPAIDTEIFDNELPVLKNAFSTLFMAHIQQFREKGIVL